MNFKAEIRKAISVDDLEEQSQVITEESGIGEVFLTDKQVIIYGSP